MAEITITGSTDVGDCFIQSDNTTLNGGTGIYCGERNDQTSVRRMLLEFDLSAIPTNAIVSSAILSIYAVQNFSSISQSTILPTSSIPNE